MNQMNQVNQADEPKTSEKRNRSDVSIDTPSSVEHLSKKRDMGDQGGSPCPIKLKSSDYDWTNGDEMEGEGRVETSTPQTKPQEQEPTSDMMTDCVAIGDWQSNSTFVNMLKSEIAKAVQVAIEPLQTIIQDL